MKDSLQTDQRLAPVPGTEQDDAAGVPADEPIARARHPADDDVGHPDDTARLPAITSHPEGIEVVEHEVCHAVGQWVLMVRCQCGKRWFELEAIDAAHCPRCNALVFIEVLQSRPR
jgi:hypothetical protein